MSLGEKIKKARKEQKLTLVKLGELLNLTQGYLSNIEGNKRKPSPEILQKLSKVLEIPFMELMAEAGYIDKDLASSVKKIEESSFKSVIKLGKSEELSIGIVISTHLKRKKNPITLNNLAFTTHISEKILQKLINGENVELTEQEISNLADALDYPFMYLYLLTEKGRKSFGLPVTDKFISGLAIGGKEHEKTFKSILEKVDIERSKGVKINEDGVKNIKKILAEISEIQQFDKFYRDKILIPSNNSIDITDFLNSQNVSYKGKQLTESEKKKIISKLREIIDN